VRKSAKLIALNLLLSLLGLACPAPARGQFIGNVSLTTISQILANGVTCTGNPQIFVTANLGQTQHLATASSLAASFAMEFQGVDALGNVYKISGPVISVTPNKFAVQTGGYMPIVQVSVTCTAAATFSLTYSGSFSANSITNVGAPGSSTTPASSFTGNVQGIVATNVNAFSVFPIVNGALQPAINAKFLTFGVDNFASTTKTELAGFTGNFTLANPPAPSAAGEGAIAFYNILATVGGGTGVLAPWTCITASCGTASSSGNAAIVSNVTTATGLVMNQTNSNNGNANVAFLEFSTLPTVRQQQFANNSTPSTPGNTVAGSVLVAAFYCASFPCQIDSITDAAQGLTWRLATSVQISNGLQPGGISVWMAGLTSAAAETVTGVAHAGTAITSSGMLELTGLGTANLNTPNTAIFAANNKNLAKENDNGGMFIERGGFSYTDTITLSAIATTTFPLWDQTQNGVFSSCILTERVTSIAGAGTTLNTFLQDSADNIGFNDRLSMTQATQALGAQNLIGTIPAFTATALTAQANSAVVSTDGVLAAGSGIAGPIGPFGRIKFVVAGNTGPVTITFNVVCR
jgi:hypothetical protein